MRVQVRPATVADEERLGSFLVDLHVTSPIAHPFKISPPRVRAMIERGTRGGGGIIGIVDGNKGDVAASIGLFLERYWWSEATFYQATWIFVAPKYRGKVDPASLFEFAEVERQRLESVLHQAGLDFPLFVESSHTNGERLAARDRLWSRFGRRIGSIFVLTPSSGKQ